MVSVYQGSIPLHMAAQGGHTAVVGLLLSKSADQLHIKDKRGRTGLHLAAANGQYDMVAQLLGSGADINSQDQVRQRGLVQDIHQMTNLIESLFRNNDAISEWLDGTSLHCQRWEFERSEITCRKWSIYQE